MGAGVPEDEDDGDDGPHSAQEVGSLVDKSVKQIGDDPIGDQTRYTQVQ